MEYLYLAIAIISEVVATSALKSTSGFTRLMPTIVVVIGYCTAFYFLSLCLQRIPIGVAYAIWAGVGIGLMAIMGLVVHDQRLDLAGVVGIGLIAAGVVVINVFSAAQVH
jgi:small multidrug resistance pump